MEKNLQAVVETPDGSVHHLPTHRQRMEVKAFVAPSGVFPAGYNMMMSACLFSLSRMGLEHFFPLHMHAKFT